MYSATAVTAAGGGSPPIDRRAARVLAMALLAAALAASALLLAPDHRRQSAALPLAAQSTVSGVLGRDAAAFGASASPHGFRMANARHGIVAGFTSAGVDVQSGPTRLRLALQSWGYGDTLRPVAQAAPAARANRVDYRRGPLTEWYVNGPLGLEQGFTLAAPPRADGDGLLTLALALDSNRTASIAPGSTGLRFGSSSLRYSGLLAFDANGRTLPARLALQGGTLRLRVDDARARYPITIDPFVQEQAKLTASDGAAQDQFGIAVAVSGDTIVAGAPADDGDSGSVYVFVKPASGWAGGLTEQAKLTASDGVDLDQLGSSVAISGDTVVAGAPFADGSAANQGAMYVFVKPASGWAGTLHESAKLTASDGAANDLLGFSAAIDGDTVVAGAPFDDIGTPAQSNKGSGYVFVKPASGWAGALNENAKLTASDGAAVDELGWSAGISGTTIALGARLDDIGFTSDQGSVDVFVKPASGWAGTLTENARLTASDGAAGDQLGFAVAVSGDRIAVGAALDDVGTFADQGSAYVFVKPPAGWSGTATERAKLTASDGSPGDQLGFAVAMNDQTVIAGAPGAGATAGSAYLFVTPLGGGSGALTENTRLVASDGAAGDHLGWWVAAAPDVVVAGAPDATDGQGAAYVFANATTCHGLTPTLRGGAGDDVLNGTNGNDVILDVEGNNTIRTKGGDDTICAGVGNDTIDAGNGNDVVDAGPGANDVTGGNGDDTITTGDDDDKVDGGNNNDTIVAGNGTNTVIGGSGDDTITTGTGDDTIDAGLGNDHVRAGDGNNRIQLKGGNDDATAGAGDDTIDGGIGIDICNPGGGVNTVTNCEL